MGGPAPEVGEGRSVLRITGRLQGRRVDRPRQPKRPARWRQGSSVVLPPPAPGPISGASVHILRSRLAPRCRIADELWGASPRQRRRPLIVSHQSQRTFASAPPSCTPGLCAPLSWRGAGGAHARSSNPSHPRPPHPHGAAPVAAGRLVAPAGRTRRTNDPRCSVCCARRAVQRHRWAELDEHVDGPHGRPLWVVWGNVHGWTLQNLPLGGTRRDDLPPELEPCRTSTSMATSSPASSSELGSSSVSEGRA